MKIDASALYALIYDISYDDNDWLSSNPPHGRYDWKIIHSELTSADDEDGGGHYDIVLEHIPTGKFYQTSYCDWDMDNTDFDEETGSIDGRCDLDCRLFEVVPKQVLTTVYSRV